MRLAALGDVLDQVDAAVEGGVGQFAELLLETWAVRHVVAEVGGQQKVFVRFRNLFICIALQALVVVFESRIDSVAVAEGGSVC